MHIRIKKGLDIPIKGKPIEFKGELTSTSRQALDLKPLPLMRLKPLFKEGQNVLQGQPILQDKDYPERVCVSPVSGKILEIQRGYKRSIDTVIMEKQSDQIFEYSSFKLETKKEIVSFLAKTGLLIGIQMRPFALVARPDLLPKQIFINAVASLPFSAPCDLQIKGLEKYFQKGLSILSQLVEGQIHLVHEKKDSVFSTFSEVKKHTISGPHPKGLSSVHIHNIHPIEKTDDITWTLGIIEVISIGYLLEEKVHYLKRICSIGGSLDEKKIGFYKIDAGISVKDLIGKELSSPVRIIAGDPLTGKETSLESFLGLYQTVLSVIAEEKKRKFLHFLRWGKNRYSTTRAYWPRKKEFAFSSHMHGELRAFINAETYDKVMPMDIPTILLIKALITEDFEKAVSLGLLEIAPEDFSLASFVCPSKIEMVSIVEEKLAQFYQMQ
jgi:Na+-transporting NADH:ubiquinone oxidoreductase subunit A